MIGGELRSTSRLTGPFVLAPNSPRLLGAVDGFEVGSYHDYVESHAGRTGLSDHVPLILDLSIEDYRLSRM